MSHINVIKEIVSDLKVPAIYTFLIKHSFIWGNSIKIIIYLASNYD